jgi:hypothetical protein
MRGKDRISLFLFMCIALATAMPLRAQAPFVTDDVGVADYHRFHFEFNNEFDQLQDSAFPNLRQNTANFKFSFGLLHNVELGFDNQLLGIFNAPTAFLPRTAVGYGDLDLSVKWDFLKEGKGWRRPALAASLNIEVPTGDDRRQLGSGVADYYLNFIAQKSVTDKTTFHLNGGVYFAGNTLTGAEGIRSTNGVVFTGGVSVVRQFTPKLDLGAELFGAVTQNLDLGRSQLQTQIGGNYAVRKNMTLDFGIIEGFYQSSPKVGPIVGLSINF